MPDWDTSIGFSRTEGHILAEILQDHYAAELTTPIASPASRLARAKSLRHRRDKLSILRKTYWIFFDEDIATAILRQRARSKKQ